MAGFPIVIVPSGGLPVTEVASGFGTPVQVASNGFGFAVTVVASGGMPVVGSQQIQLSASTVLNTKTSGFTIGALSVLNGSGSYTYTLTSNPGNLFAISGSNLNVALALATPTNSAFSAATTGGSLVAGTYFYRVSATDAAGETLASAETSQVVPAGTATNTVTVNWGAVSGATGYKVYGRTTGAELLIATVGAVTTFTDTGAVTPSGALPASNTTLLAIGSDPITVHADNGAGSVLNGSFLITVLNGSYVPTFELLGF